MRIRLSELRRVVHEEALRLQEGAWSRRAPGVGGRRRKRGTPAVGPSAPLTPEAQTTMQHLGDARDSLGLALESLGSDTSLIEHINVAVDAITKARMALRKQR